MEFTFCTRYFQCDSPNRSSLKQRFAPNWLLARSPHLDPNPDPYLDSPVIYCELKGDSDSMTSLSRGDLFKFRMINLDGYLLNSWTSQMLHFRSALAQMGVGWFFSFQLNNLYHLISFELVDGSFSFLSFFRPSISPIIIFHPFSNFVSALALRQTKLTPQFWGLSMAYGLTI